MKPLTLLTAAMLLNLALIGWLGNTAVARWRAGEGAGLLVVTGVAMGLATLSTLYLAEGLSTIVNTAAAFESLDF